MYVRDGSNYIVYVMLFMSEMLKIYKHVFAHNLLNIQWIFNPEKSFEKLRHRAFQPYHQILCILKHVGDVGDRSSTPKGCSAMYVGDIRDYDNLQYTQDLMVWLKRPKSQFSKTFSRLKIR